jgi:hypothetical protein
MQNPLSGHLPELAAMYPSRPIAPVVVIQTRQNTSLCALATATYVDWLTKAAKPLQWASQGQFWPQILIIKLAH